MKQIIPKIEFLPNYLWHIYTLSNLWEKDRSEYLDNHKEHIISDDARYLYDNRDFLAWGNSRGGDLIGLLFFIPLGLSWMNYEKYLQYLDHLIESSQARAWNQFKQDYSFDYDMSEVIFPQSWITFFKHYKVILQRNHQAYLTNLWPLHEVELEKSGKLLVEYFSNLNAIEKWEKFLGREFPADEFHIILTVPNKNLPSANNLSPTRYNFYHDPDNPTILHNLLLHEIGTNLLADELELNRNDKDLQTETIKKSNLVYQAFESLAEFSKAKIFGGKPKEWHGRMFGGGNFCFDEFYCFYDQQRIFNQKDGYLVCNKKDLAKLMKEAIQYVVK